MLEIELSPVEVEPIRELVETISTYHGSVEDPDFLDQAPVYAHELPRALRESLTSFRLGEVSGVCRISGFPVDDEKIGPSPDGWDGRKVPSPTFHEEVYFFLCASLVGDPVGWATQQGGYVMHELAPTRAHETEQLGSGSATVLTWHTEEAFHPLRADYIMLMCLRNPDEVETTFASIEDLKFDETTRQTLSRPLFQILPDNSHRRAYQARLRAGLVAPETLINRSHEKIVRMCDDPDLVPVLFGDPDSPYLRVDPYFMQVPAESEGRDALGHLIEQIDKAIRGVALRPGDIIMLDNYRVVHGRRAFKARYDGSDRWLKRLNVVRDLRKSRGSRVNAAGRVIF
ncbi:MAG TPA: guanitoxin biosynthesis L-enduracididine beta-hydroxylase GntD [Solirubrobacteraceae bacterium]|nr:guanitoxin biosynthesis L-enduracididine beta-hydroxylase GntD [Solirubrobacteraceae bacterium]